MLNSQDSSYIYIMYHMGLGIYLVMCAGIRYDCSTI